VARIFQRRFAWLVVPSVVGVVVAAIVALALPPVYTASTTILIEPPGIPDRLVETTVVQDKEARFHNIRLRIHGVRRVGIVTINNNINIAVGDRIVDINSIGLVCIRGVAVNRLHIQALTVIVA